MSALNFLVIYLLFVYHAAKILIFLELEQINLYFAFSSIKNTGRQVPFLYLGGTYSRESKKGYSKNQTTDN